MQSFDDFAREQASDLKMRSNDPIIMLRPVAEDVTEVGEKEIEMEEAMGLHVEHVKAFLSAFFLGATVQVLPVARASFPQGKSPKENLRLFMRTLHKEAPAEARCCLAITTVPLCQEKDGCIHGVSGLKFGSGVATFAGLR